MAPASKDEKKDDSPELVDTKGTDGKAETEKQSPSKKKGGKGKLNKDGTKIEKDEDTMSEEDRALKERLDTCVYTVLGLKLVGEGEKATKEKDPLVTVPLRLKALDTIVDELRSATSSMTSVPKPLKFLRPHYASLKTLYQSINPTEEDNEWLGLRARLSDVLSVLAMTMGKPDERESLLFKLSGHKDYQTLVSRGDDKFTELGKESLGSWGHEFVRSLAGEIGQEYNARILAKPLDADMGDKSDDNADVADLLDMVNVIVSFHVTHNAEAEAVDLLIEVQRLKVLLEQKDIVHESNYARICLYLVKTADFMSDPDDVEEMLDTAQQIYFTQHKYLDSLRVGLRKGVDTATITQMFEECANQVEAATDNEEMASTFRSMRKQMSLLLARHRSSYVYDLENEEDETMDNAEDGEELKELMGNALLSEHFLKVAQDLDVVDAKTPEDIYKSHLAETGGFSRSRGGAGGAQVDSARANLASTFVNAFVNAGFGHDKLMTGTQSSEDEANGEESKQRTNEWLYKNKDHGMMSATASLGLILLWNVEEGLSQIDKYLYSSEDYIKAGAALAVGILSSGVKNDADPAFALLTEHVEGDVHIMKCAACTGLGIAYAGSGREDVQELLLPVLESSSEAASGPQTFTEVCLAGLALGMVYVGKCDEDVATSLVQRLMEATEEELNHSHAKYLCLSLGLLFLGHTEKAQAMLEVVRTVEHKISKFAVIVLETCAYAGSGNVLKVQEMLHECAEHLTEDADHQMAAVLGIGLITMGEEVGAEMALRAFDHLLHYCELPIKRAVPLSLAVLHISNPDFVVIDQLSRLSHDPDPELSQNAILAMGLVSAGTNNSRVAGLLRQLSEFYSKDAGHVFCVRISQGLLHMGKGLLTLNPNHSDRLLTCAPSLGAVLILLTSAFDLKRTLLDKSHYLLYYLTCAMSPRMLVTVDSEMNWKPITVRVGQAVETVGQAGKPKTITGFQTHTTPVLIGVQERAELGTEEFISVSSVLEGVVIVQNNPEYEAEEGTK